jgi:hypothetical protein
VRVERGTQEAPSLDPAAEGHRVRCFRHAEIAAGEISP